MKLRSDLVVEDDPMSCESNKENIRLPKSSSGQLSFGGEGNETAESSGTASFVPSSDEALLIKEPALVNTSSESH